MPYLEIHYGSGATETREIYRNSPVSIGRAAVNDIRTESGSVAPIHCRISAKGPMFVVAASTPAGVLYNGEVVASSNLSSGDVLNVGDVEVVFLAELGKAAPDANRPSTKGAQERSVSQEIQLRALSSDEIPAQRSVFVPAGVPVSPRPRDKSIPRAPDVPLLTAAERAAASVPPARPPRHDPAPPIAESFDDDQEPSVDPLASIPSSRRGRPVSPTGGPLGKFGVRPVRPGEQDVLRSPLVLGLGGGALALLLTAATLWFILGRETAERKFEAAQKALDSGLYTQAIEGFDVFLKDHPRHARAGEARAALGTARVDQAIAGSTPAWDRGLEALNQFIAQYKDTDEFQDPESIIRRFVVKSSGNIALGAAEMAKTAKKKSLVDVSAEATRLLELYESPTAPPLKLLEEIAVAVRGAQAAILRQDTFDDAAKQIDAALAKKDALTAFDKHRRLLERYHDFTGYRPLDERLQKALNLEQTRVVREEAPRNAATEPRDAPVALPTLSLARRTRTRSDEASLGATVFALAEDCCYGVDTVTGEPLWRRVIGLDPPFLPVPAAAGVPALLTFDTRHRDLLLLEQRSGKLLWRQPLDEAAVGEPLIHAGQVYQATAAGNLYQIDLGTGRMSVRLKFTQPLSGSPVLSHSGDRMYLPGHHGVVYILKRSPLACETVTYLGHAPGAISAPLLMLRSYLLVADNDRLKGCKLRVLDTSREEKPPLEIASARIEGQVHELPALRGKQLFVPSDPERVHAFTVSETKDKNALTPVASYQVKNGLGGPIFLAAGPDDQMWMASSALRRFQLVKDTLRADKQQLAVGLSTQPLQIIGDSLFLGRRFPYSRAVVFTKADRQRMVGQWQVALGGAILELSGPSPKDPGAAACVTTTGDVYLITAAKLQAGGFDLQSVAQLPIPDDLAAPLQAVRLVDGRLAVHCGGAQPRLWTVTADGVVQPEQKLPQALEAAPIAFAGGLLLPLAGKLRVIGQGAGQSKLEDFVPAISKKAPPRWRGITSLDNIQVIAVSEEGRVRRIQQRKSPVAHLAEVVHWDAGSPVDFSFVLDQGRLAVADSKSRLTLLDANSLEPLAEVQLDKPVMQALWMTGGRLLIEVGGEQIVSLDMTQKLEQQWSLALPPGALLAGAPYAREDDLILAFRHGEVWRINAQTGETLRKINLEQPLTFGPRQLGETIVVGTLDGSLVQVNAILEDARE